MSSSVFHSSISPLNIVIKLLEDNQRVDVVNGKSRETEKNKMKENERVKEEEREKERKTERKKEEDNAEIHV